MNNIDRPHCQSCGSSKAEDVSNLRDTEGYTRCCNELVISPKPAEYRPFFMPAETCRTINRCYHD